MQVALILFITLIVIGSILSDVFLTPNNLLNILWAVSILGIVALGQCILIITCRFDMSVAYSVGLCGIITVVVQNHGVSLFPSVIIGLLSGLLIGSINGLICVRTKANPFLVTLGTGICMYAISLAITKSQTVYTPIDDFKLLGRAKLFGTIQYSILIFLGLAIILEIMLRYTKFGRSLFVIGLNEKVSTLSGFSTSRISMAAFVICGFTAAIGSLIITSRNGSTVANVGMGMEFDSIIAVVLGGTSLFGGSGGAIRTVVGVLTLGVLNNLMVLMNIPTENQQIAKGTIFLLIVWLDSLLRNKK
jgi:ribose transport system permease protein